ncbi:MAG: hypothetical protein M3Q69_07330 [Acidobacteriota bacterium]|nr:hypothetical protein [Acidobacteriota bacterium]
MTKNGFAKVRDSGNATLDTLTRIQRAACFLAQRYVRIDELFDFYTPEQFEEDCRDDSASTET